MKKHHIYLTYCYPHPQIENLLSENKELKQLVEDLILENRLTKLVTRYETIAEIKGFKQVLDSEMQVIKEPRGYN